MKQYRITLENQTFDVKVLSDPRQAQVQVEVDGEVLTVGVAAVPTEADIPVVREQGSRETRTPGSKRAQTQGGKGAEAHGSGVTAPLPGVVKSVAVQPGQQVAAGDTLLVIEAMKMDNAVRSARAGTVGAVHVAAGQQVAHGALLVEFTG